MFFKVTLCTRHYLKFVGWSCLWKFPLKLALYSVMITGLLTWRAQPLKPEVCMEIKHSCVCIFPVNFLPFKINCQAVEVSMILAIYVSCSKWTVWVSLCFIQTLCFSCLAFRYYWLKHWDWTYMFFSVYFENK